VEVGFALDADGLLTVRAREKQTGVSQVVQVKPSYGLTLQEIQERLMGTSG
jgi:molecular chaperone HscA